MGVDWSGFGADRTSTTVVVVAMTLPSDNAIRIPYMERLPLGISAEEESSRIKALYNTLGCHRFAHDYSGAGVIREALVTQMGMKRKSIVPFSIVHAPVRSKVISYYKPADGARSCYNIDKTRSYLILYQMIKAKNVVFPRWESCEGVLSDLLHIILDSRENPRGADYVIIDRVEGTTDDAVSAINFACSTIWHAAGKYPQMAPAVSNESEYEELVGGMEETKRVQNRLKELRKRPTLLT